MNPPAIAQGREAGDPCLIVHNNILRSLFHILVTRYKGFQGNNSKPEFQASGAYIFRPDGNTPTPVNSMATTTIVKVIILIISTVRGCSCLQSLQFWGLLKMRVMVLTFFYLWVLANMYHAH